MEIKRKLINHLRRGHFKYTIYDLDFRGTDVQRLGDLALCPKCNCMFYVAGLPLHLIKTHSFSSKEAQLVYATLDNKTHCHSTPKIDWFLVECHYINGGIGNRVYVLCDTNKLVKELIECKDFSSFKKVIESSAYLHNESLEYFEKFLDYKINVYFGGKGNLKIKKPPVRTNIEGSLEEKIAKIPFIKPCRYIPKFKNYYLELEREIEAISLQNEREDIFELLNNYLSIKPKSEPINIVSGILFYYLRKTNRASSFVKYSIKTGISYQELFKWYKKVEKQLGRIPYDLNKHLTDFCIVLSISPNTQNEMERLIEVLVKVGYTSGKTPINILLGLWFYVENKTPQPLIYGEQKFSTTQIGGYKRKIDLALNDLSVGNKF